MSSVTTQLRSKSSGITPPLFQRDGPLTAELLLEPARFGLGLLPNEPPAGTLVANLSAASAPLAAVSTSICATTKPSA